MNNRDIATRLINEIELLQFSSKEIGIPYRRTALAIIEDALNEAADTREGQIAPPAKPMTAPPFFWPTDGRVLKFDA